MGTVVLSYLFFAVNGIQNREWGDFSSCPRLISAKALANASVMLLPMAR